MKKASPGGSKLDQVVADARKKRESREQDYREQALKLYPWICDKCAREFTRTNLLELTVHHRDHNHDNNPQDGSNWALLCVYCHDNEHSRYIDNVGRGGPKPGGDKQASATHNPFASLGNLLNEKK